MYKNNFTNLQHYYYWYPRQIPKTPTPYPNGQREQLEGTPCSDHSAKIKNRDKDAPNCRGNDILTSLRQVGHKSPAEKVISVFLSGSMPTAKFIHIVCYYTRNDITERNCYTNGDSYLVERVWLWQTKYLHGRIHSRDGIKLIQFTLNRLCDSSLGPFKTIIRRLIVNLKKFREKKILISLMIQLRPPWFNQPT